MSSMTSSSFQRTGSGYMQVVFVSICIVDLMNNKRIYTNGTNPTIGFIVWNAITLA